MEKIKGLLLLSGGIDSPVAGKLMLDKGMELDAVYFDNFLRTENDTRDRAFQSARALGLKSIYVVRHAENLSEFGKLADQKYVCVFCKRMMLRVSEKLAKKIKADCLVTGDNLAQVASQTLPNMFIVSSAVSIPVVRPLIGLDKNEIIEYAKEFGTYGISTQRTLCCRFVPSKPSTNASSERIKAEEKNINIDLMVNQSIKGIEKVAL
ncbi:MAG: hypothetical protein V1911_00915 [Candidatus Micrarchaeota archaeon]